MRIAYVYDAIHPYVIGGAQKRIWELAKRLTQRGHEVTIFGMKHWEGEDIVYKEGVRLWGVCPPQDLFVNGRRSIKEAIYFAFRVLPPLLKERFDIIDAVNFPYFPCFSAKFHSITRKSCLIITWHEVWNNYWFEYLGRKGIFGKAVEKLTTRLPHKAIAVSTRTEGDLERLGGKHIEMIPDGADLKKIESIPPSEENSDIIFVGRLIKEKNLSLLIKTVNLVKKRLPNINCLIIGDGPEKESLKRLVQELDLVENVHFKGYVEDDIEVLSCMKSSKVFVLPSLREGFGIVAVEANACGLPVITVKHPQNAASDLIANGENGFICELSESDIAEKIITAMDIGNNWERKCREFAKEYDWDVIAASLEGVYETA